MRASRLLLLAGAAAAGLVLALLGRGTTPPPPAPDAAPLATPAAVPGRAGGLLPDAELSGRIRPERSRELRPGVFLLVAPDCGCLAAVRKLARDTAPLGLVTYVVQAGADRRQVDRLAAAAGGRMAPYADPAGVLASTYRLRSPAALVLVRADGIVTRVIDAVGSSLRLGAALRELLQR